MNKATLLLVLVGLAALLGGSEKRMCSAEKILVVAFISSKSHKLTYMPLIEELGKRGHSITVLTPIKQSKEMKNVKEVLTMDAEAIMHKIMKDQGFDIFKMKETHTQPSPFLVFDMFAQSCRDTYDLPQVHEILKEKFDLVFLQPLFNECALGLVHRIGAPLVLFTPISVPSFIGIKMGNFFPPSLTPNLFLELPLEMTFVQRMKNFGTEIMYQIIMKFIHEPKVEALYREKLGQDIPSVNHIMGSASLLLSNGHFSLQGHKPLLPDTVEVGGIHSWKPAKPLPKDLEDFIKKGKENGFIYFSMGSAIRGSDMPEEKRKVFLNVFSKLKQQVLWKWETESMPDLPANVKLSKWLPQQDLLGRQDIKVFITHCGGGSVEESIFHGVPLIGLPMLGDQPINARLAQKHGFMVEIDWNTITEEQLLNAINDILNNPNYYNNAKKISSLFKDQPDNPLTRGVYWVEYVMRHKGAMHLRSNPARNLNFLQFHSIDVMGAYLGIIATVLCIIYATLRFLIRCCRGGKSASVSPLKKQN